MLHQDFGGRGPCGDTNDSDIVQPFAPNFFSAIDEIGVGTLFVGQFPESVGVGTVGGAYHQQEFTVPGEILYGVLTVLGGVTDVTFARALDAGVAVLKGGDNFLGVVHRQGSLGYVSQMVRVTDWEVGHIGDFLDKIDAATVATLTHGALHLRVTAMPDQDDLVAIAAMSRNFKVDLGNKWTGGIKNT